MPNFGLFRNTDEANPGLWQDTAIIHDAKDRDEALRRYVDQLAGQDKFGRFMVVQIEDVSISSVEPQYDVVAITPNVPPSPIQVEPLPVTPLHAVEEEPDHKEEFEEPNYPADPEPVEPA